jgi:hypothetical protein
MRLNTCMNVSINSIIMNVVNTILYITGVRFMSQYINYIMTIYLFIYVFRYIWYQIKYIKPKITVYLIKIGKLLNEDLPEKIVHVKEKVPGMYYPLMSIPQGVDNTEYNYATLDEKLRPVNIDNSCTFGADGYLYEMNKPDKSFDAKLDIPIYNKKTPIFDIRNNTDMHLAKEEENIMMRNYVTNISKLNKIE